MEIGPGRGGAGRGGRDSPSSQSPAAAGDRQDGASRLGWRGVGWPAPLLDLESWVLLMPLTERKSPGAGGGSGWGQGA